MDLASSTEYALIGVAQVYFFWSLLGMLSGMLLIILSVVSRPRRGRAYSNPVTR